MAKKAPGPESVVPPGAAAAGDASDEFPKMLYALQGGRVATKIVASAEEQAAAGKKWQEEPPEPFSAHGHREGAKAPSAGER